jgi:glycerate kinase
VEHGADRIILGVGGSATVDGGLGMLAALGFSITDEAGNASWRGGEGLSRLARVVANSPMKQTRLVVASDVTNPLLGLTGAAPVFGPQKGATPDMVTLLEKGLERLADISHGWVVTWSQALNSSWISRISTPERWDAPCW